MTKFLKIYYYSTETLLEGPITFHQAYRDINKCSSRALKILFNKKITCIFSKVRGDLNFPKMGKGNLP